MRNYLWNQLMKMIGRLLLPLLPAASLMAQQSQPIRLQEAIDSALLANRELLLSRADEKIAKAQWQETEAVYLPQVDLSFSALSSNNPLNVFGFKLQQQRVEQADFNPSLLNSPGSVGDFVTKIQLQQPIINVDKWYMRKAAATQRELYSFRSQRTAEYLSYEVTKAFLQLQLSYDAEAVLKEALQTARSVQQFTQDRVDQGLLQKSDILNVQVWITTIESNLAEAGSNIRNASDYLSWLMGRSAGNVYLPVDQPLHEPVLTNNQVPANRADFAAMRKALEASDLMIKSNKFSMLPRLNGFASYQLNDNRLLGFGSNAYLAGIQMSWDIFKGNGARRKLATQTEERNKLALQLQNHQEQSQLELNKTARQLADAEFRIQQQISAVAQATEALRILQDRYEQGLVNSTDILLAQSQLSQQKLGLAQARFNRHATAAYYQFLTTQTNQE